MMWYGGHMTGWGYAFMGLGNLVFWAVLIVGGVALFRHLGRMPAPPGSTPEALLGERFARGEIDDEEYRRRLATLRGNRPTPAP
jgi:putative membrane protein